MKKILLSSIAIATFTLGADNVAPSINPPGGIEPKDAPIFVCVGWDDNAYADATDWIEVFLKDKKNKDGSPVRTTFLPAAGLIGTNFNEEGNPGKSANDLQASWKRLADDGHEIGNHTYNHAHGSGKDKSWWDSEIDQCNAGLTTDLGIPQSEITGFRTPFLEYSTGTFESLKEHGLEYDCSIEFGYNWVSLVPGYTDSTGWHSAIAYSPGKASGGKMHYWPYTLDNDYAPGSTPYGGATIGKIPGFWEITVNAFQNVPAEWDESNPDSINDDWNTSGVITGFDYNMWKSVDKATFLRMMKFAFHQSKVGNHAPINFNLHTDNYSEFNSEAISDFSQSTWQERREAIEEFIDYVLQFDNVRVVPYNVVIDYMRNPQTSDEYVAPTKSNGQTAVAYKSKLKSSSNDVSVMYTTNNELSLTVPQAGFYKVSILTLSGREIATLSQGNLSTGKHSFSLHGVTNASGLYLVRVSGKINSTSRLLIK